MTRRSALHGRRGFHRDLKRAGPVLGLPIPEPILTPPTPPNAKDKDKNTPTTSTTSTDLLGILSGILSSATATGSTTSKLSSSTTSTSSVSSTTSSVTTSSLPTTRASVPTVTSATPHVVVQTATRVSSSTSLQSLQTQTQTPSETAQPSSGASAITIIGGIGGALLGTILLTVLIGFFLRRWRRNKSGDNAFEASQFRRSAALLDEKDDDSSDCPRPPSMIERRNATSPPAAYPSDEPPLSAIEHGQSFAQYGANQSQYGTIPQHPSFAVGSVFGGNGGAPAMHYGADPYTMSYGQGDTISAAYSGPGEKPGYGAPPVPGIHGPGTYAPYGVDHRYPQPQRYPHFNQNQNQQHQPRGFGQGPAVDTTTSPTRDENVPTLANPFLPLRITKKSGSAENSGPESLPALPSSTPPPSTNPGTTPFVTRQSHDALPSYTNNGGYADVQRDVKISPTSLNVVNSSSDTAVPPVVTAATTVTESKGNVLEPPRPLTVYGDDDVYGGM